LVPVILDYIEAQLHRLDVYLWQLFFVDIYDFTLWFYYLMKVTLRKKYKDYKKRYYFFKALIYANNGIEVRDILFIAHVFKIFKLPILNLYPHFLIFIYEITPDVNFFLKYHYRYWRYYVLQFIYKL
jgi:hypothetical protein